MGNTKLFCENPWTTFFIDGNGAACICPYSDKLNVNYEYSIDEIWNCDTLQRMRSELLKGIFAKECKKVCPKRLWSEDRKTKEPDNLKNQFDRAVSITTGPAKENILINRQEINLGKTILSSKPYHWSICFSMACNIRCIFCYNQGKYHMSVSEKTVSDIKNYYHFIHTLGFSGGEPTISQEFWEMTHPRNFEKNPQWQAHLGTNGLFMPEEMIDRLSRYFDETIFSIRAGSKDTYERLQVGAEWNKLMKNIEALNNAIIKNNGKGKITFLYVMMRSNYKEFFDFVRLADKFNVQKCLVFPVQPAPGTKDELLFNDGTTEEFKELYDIVLRCKREFSTRIYLYGLEWIESLLKNKLNL